MNSVSLIGNITKDIEVRMTTTGKKVCAFTLAVRRDAKETDFINCVAWEGTCDILERYVKKGDKVGANGRLQVRSYENQNGQKVYVSEVIVNQIHLIEKKEKAEQQQPQQQEIKPSRYIEIEPDELPFY